MTGRRVAVSTQEQNPRSASVRTGLAALVGMLVLLNPVLAVVIEVLRPYDAAIPGWVFIWLNGAITVTAVAIALVTRIMAVPGVNEWLRRYAKWLAPEDKAQTPADPELTEDYHLATRDGLTIHDGGTNTVRPRIDGYFSTPIEVTGDTTLDPDK